MWWHSNTERRSTALMGRLPFQPGSGKGRDSHPSTLMKTEWPPLDRGEQPWPPLPGQLGWLLGRSSKRRGIKATSWTLTPEFKENLQRQENERHIHMQSSFCSLASSCYSLPDHRSYQEPITSRCASQLTARKAQDAIESLSAAEQQSVYPCYHHHLWYPKD